MWDGPLANWIAALDQILAMDVDIIVPGHGPITDKDGAKALKEYWQWAETEARKRYDAGMPAAVISPHCGGATRASVAAPSV